MGLAQRLCTVWLQRARVCRYFFLSMSSYFWRFFNQNPGISCLDPPFTNNETSRWTIFPPASMIFNRPLTTNNTQRTLPHIGPARVTYLKIRLTYWVVPDQERKHWFKLRKSLFTPYFCLEQHCKIPRGWIVATNLNSFLCKKKKTKAN